MLGTLTRYLRFMGYDTLSANSLEGGNAAEDTVLLRIAENEGRILLTRDRELARRGGKQAI
ncbi:MAG: Mut7-C RNAse domain-containing protein, partial [Methanomicrobiales archaeon]|nr:Mut7-C RNAse domain-containing protein [Methanomicrobiales archaeon]